MLDKKLTEREAWLHAANNITRSSDDAKAPMMPPEYTGGSVSYYQLHITNPTTKGRPAYTAECNDIIEGLKMSYAEGNAFKAIWRRCAAQNLGLGKKGYTDGKYDAEKVVFFGERLVKQHEGK